jgi:hypothetical protein
LRLRQSVYPNASAEAAWDLGSPESPVNSMIYLILSPNSVTAVLDDPAAPEIRSILKSMRNALGMDIPNAEAELFLGESASLWNVDIHQDEDSDSVKKT